MQTEELKKVPKLLEADDMIEDKDEEEGENMNYNCSNVTHFREWFPPLNSFRPWIVSAP